MLNHRFVITSCRCALTSCRYVLMSCRWLCLLVWLPYSHLPTSCCFITTLCSCPIPSCPRPIPSCPRLIPSCRRSATSCPSVRSHYSNYNSNYISTASSIPVSKEVPGALKKIKMMERKKGSSLQLEATSAHGPGGTVCRSLVVSILIPISAGVVGKSHFDTYSKWPQE